MLKRCKRLGYYHSSAIVIYKGMEVKLFFTKTAKRGSYNILLTTNTALSFEKPYKIYANRWFIEVFFRESKQHLQLVECQSQVFDAQIAATMLGMLQYNLLAVARRFSAYQTSGELFRAIKKETFQLTVREHIRQIIISIVAEIAQMMYENQILAKVINLNPYCKRGKELAKVEYVIKHVSSGSSCR